MWYCPPWTAAEGTIAKFVIEVPELALAGSTCAGQPRALKNGQKHQALPNEVFFLLTDRFQVLQRRSLEFSRKSSKNCLRGINVKSYLTPRVDPMLKLSNHEATPYFLYFYGTKVLIIFPGHFLEIDLEIWQACSMNPCQSGDECFFFPWPPENLDVWG